jgi:CRISPR-associated protein Cmr3
MRVLLIPIDTWFFRDSTSYYMDASPQAGVRGVFPPYPSTVSGAIRAALARDQGWNGAGSWSEELKPVLGHGPDDLGQLTFMGPFVVRDSEPVFPMPRHVVIERTAKGRDRPFFWSPNKREIFSDLGSSRQFPGRSTPDHVASNPVEGLWLTLAGLRHVLRGELPSQSDLVHRSKLWREEPHIGIQRQLETRTTGEGALYSAHHVRLSAGVGLGVETIGVPDDWSIAPGSMLPLGGESRLAACESWDFELTLEVAPQSPTGWTTLIALTPALVEHSALCGDTELIAGTGLRVTSACVDRPVRIGGWDSLARQPLRLQNALAPGTTLFCQGDLPRLQVARGMVRLGKRTSAGFGLFAIGATPG